MKLFAALLAAAAGALGAANSVGTCTLSLASPQDSCTAAFNACLTEVKLAPGDTANTANVTMPSTSCFTGTPTFGVTVGVYIVSYQSPEGVAYLSRGSSSPANKVEFNIGSDCAGALNIDSGACMTGPGPTPTPTKSPAATAAATTAATPSAGASPAGSPGTSASSTPAAASNSPAAAHSSAASVLGMAAAAFAGAAALML